MNSQGQVASFCLEDYATIVQRNRCSSIRYIYCSDISEAIQRFGKDYTVLTQDAVYKNATALCVLQIGELTTHLSDDFKNTYTGIPWTQIKALRNVVAHNYGKIDDAGICRLLVCLATS